MSSCCFTPGNIGVKQGLEFDRRGGGAGEGNPPHYLRRWRREARHRGVDRRARSGRNVTLLPLQSEEDYWRMMEDADVCVISQRTGSGGASFPGKLLSCVAFEKPVLAVADRESELARVVWRRAWGYGSRRGMSRRWPRRCAGYREAGRDSENGDARENAGTAVKEARVLREFEEVLKEVAEPPGVMQVPAGIGPGGLPAISRGWSEAQPPDTRPTRNTPRQGRRNLRDELA